MKVKNPRLLGNSLRREKMKKIMAITFSLFLMMSLSSPALGQMFKIGSHVNYYSPKDSIYKEVYGKGGPMFGVSLSRNIFWKIEIRAEVNYFQDKGGMTLTEEEVKFTLMPIVVGTRVRVIETNRLSAYIGAGFDFCLYKEDLPDRFDDVSESATGYHFEVGTYVYLFRGFYGDIQIRYLKLDAEPFEERIKLGGLRAGVGIGYRF
jgi:hypothetical protein